MEYDIDKGLKTVFTKAFDTLTEEELSSHRKRVMRDTAFDPSFNQFSDFSEVTKFDVTSNFVVQFAQLKYFSKGSRRAFVAPSDIVFGSARAYQAWHESLPSQVEVFRNIEDARKWLHLDKISKS